MKAPKFLDAEFEKHRMISSNSSSDRAIPFNKMKDQEFFVPKDVRLNQSGMQGYEKLAGLSLSAFETALTTLRGRVLSTVGLFDEVHKQHLNRYLIPWSMQSKVATATRDQWEYFLSLRDSEAADPAIQELARKIKDAITNSVTTPRVPGDWHLPYITHKERIGYDISLLKLASVARCARVSYGNHDGTDADVDRDVLLAERLLSSQHMSPFEHIAMPMVYKKVDPDYWNAWQDGVTHATRDGGLWSGNFKGWVQLRHLL